MKPRLERNTLERIHLLYLVENFAFMILTVDMSFVDFKPDLVGLGEKDTLFELKTRVYPVNQSGERKRPKSDFAWWPLEMTQIRRYERYAESHGSEIFWLLILGYSNCEVREIKSEGAFYQRDIYVVPWEIYKPIAARNQTHIGLNTLVRLELQRYDIGSCSVYIDRTVSEKVGRYFHF